jgi:hypothetical protein
MNYDDRVGTVGTTVPMSPASVGRIGKSSTLLMRDLKHGQDLHR